MGRKKECKKREKDMKRMTKGKKGRGMTGKGWGIRKSVGKEQRKGEERRENSWEEDKRVGETVGKENGDGMPGKGWK